MSSKEKKAKTPVKRKKSRILEILKKDYKWESYLFFFISLVVLLLGILILTNALTINSDAWLIGTYPKPFAIILVVLGSITLLYAIYPFFKPAFPELKKITWLTGKKYFANFARVAIFLIIFALLFLLYETFITEILRRILG